MLTVNDESINSELAYSELKIIEALLSERNSEMEHDIDSKDRHKYLELLQLEAKISGMIFLVEHEKEKKLNKQMREVVYNEIPDAIKLNNKENI